MSVSFDATYTDGRRMVDFDGVIYVATEDTPLRAVYVENSGMWAFCHGAGPWRIAPAAAVSGLLDLKTNRPVEGALPTFSSYEEVVLWVSMQPTWEPKKS